MKKHTLLCAAILMSLIVFTNARAQTGISPEKKKIIAEIVTVTKADKRIEQVMQAMFGQMNQMYPLMMQSSLKDRKDLTAAQKAEIENALIKKNQDFVGRFQNKMLKAINFQEYIEATIYPLYDKFFTEAELRDLLTFYKTPTGQKLNESLPQFAAESVRLSQDFLMPKLNGIVDEMIKEDAERGKNPPPKK